MPSNLERLRDQFAELLGFVSNFSDRPEVRPFHMVNVWGEGGALNDCPPVRLSRILACASEFVDTSSRELCHRLRWYGQIIEARAADEGEEAARLFDFLGAECLAHVVTVRARSLRVGTMEEKRWAKLSGLCRALASDIRGDVGKADLFSSRMTLGGDPSW